MYNLLGFQLTLGGKRSERIDCHYTRYVIENTTLVVKDEVLEILYALIKSNKQPESLMTEDELMLMVNLSKRHMYYNVPLPDGCETCNIRLDGEKNGIPHYREAMDSIKAFVALDLFYNDNFSVDQFDMPEDDITAMMDEILHDVDSKHYQVLMDKCYSMACVLVHKVI